MRAAPPLKMDAARAVEARARALLAAVGADPDAILAPM
jgi:hypothetical protein